MDNIDRNNLIKGYERMHVWHPFTQMREWDGGVWGEPVVISEARDAFLKDICGRWYLDAVSSLWVNVHGHRRAEIDDALRAQLGKVAHSTLLGLANEPSALLAGALAGLLKKSFGGFGSPVPSKVFYSDNGSTAVEVALKTAFQYWKQKGAEGRDTFVTLNNAYHGDTLGAVSVGGIGLFHETFKPLLFDVLRAPSPSCYRCELALEPASCGMQCLNRMEDILKEHGARVCAVIVEPLVQGAAGMHVAPKGYLKGVRGLCTKYKTLLITDEVATGFGRTGRMFASEHEGVVPDIICLSKGLTGGYMPLAATISTEEIYRAFLGGYEESRTFFHGHSYTGNPLGCAAALASLGLFETDGTLEALKGKIDILEEGLKDICELAHVGDARNAGFMAGVELVRDKETKEPYKIDERVAWRVSLKLRKRGVMLRPLGDVLIIVPPLSISEENLRMLLVHIKETVAEVTGG